MHTIIIYCIFLSFNVYKSRITGKGEVLIESLSDVNPIELLLQENMKAPAFKFPIYVKCIHKGKHGSDSGVYDAQGRY
jgi:hypothetical protein